MPRRPGRGAGGARRHGNPADRRPSHATTQEQVDAIRKAYEPTVRKRKGTEAWPHEVAVAVAGEATRLVVDLMTAEQRGDANGAELAAKAIGSSRRHHPAATHAFPHRPNKPSGTRGHGKP